ncbi:hypothetical protein FHG87_008969 [Trinorchestia longiramus]|nr:hypothetical protein FHG87_008969 [Trinorchestia longiramus]
MDAMSISRDAQGSIQNSDGLCVFNAPRPSPALCTTCPPVLTGTSTSGGWAADGGAHTTFHQYEVQAHTGTHQIVAYEGRFSSNITTKLDHVNFRPAPTPSTPTTSTPTTSTPTTSTPTTSTPTTSTPTTYLMKWRNGGDGSVALWRPALI